MDVTTKFTFHHFKQKSPPTFSNTCYCHVVLPLKTTSTITNQISSITNLTSAISNISALTPTVDNSDGVDLAPIIGGIIGAIVLIAIIVILLCIRHHKIKRRKQEIIDKRMKIWKIRSTEDGILSELILNMLLNNWTFCIIFLLWFFLYITSIYIQVVYRVFIQISMMTIFSTKRLWNWTAVNLITPNCLC